MLITKLKNRYRLGLILIGLVAVLSQVLVQWHLTQKKGDSYIIDVAGKQRMFSQKITKDILVIEPQPIGSMTSSKKYLAESLAKFKSVHQNLKSRSTGKFKGENSKEIAEFYTQINPYYDQLTKAAQCYLDESVNCEESASTILDVESNFLKIMDSIVSSYSLDLEESLNRLRIIEFLFLALILTLLFLEALYIFKPTMNLVETSFASLERQKEISEKNFKLATAGEVSAGLVHELKNPLFIIKGKCEIMMMKLKSGELSSEESYKQMEKILESVERTNDVIFGLLNATRVQSSTDLLPFDTVKCIQENLAFTNHLAREADIRVIPLLPLEKITALGNCSHVSQVLLNIISNALYEAKSSDEKEMTVRLDSNSDFIFIKIKNTGTPISEETAKKIFVPFFTTKANDQGNGLGLSVSRNLMRKMQGDLYLDTSEKLTTFVIKIKAS